MSTPTIPAGNLYMNATLWTGTGNVANTITNGVAGQSFQPDFVWAKARSNTYDYVLYDSVRGTGTGTNLASNNTAAEGANSIYANLSSFNSNGFSIGTTSATNILNNSGSTFVGWQWKAGGAAVSNTSGTITSQVSANTTSGFSIVSYTAPASGAFSVGHGLGAVPSFIIQKNRTTVTNWFTQHISTGTQYMQLNGTGVATTDSTVWNSAPTSSVINVGSGFSGSVAQIIYCWTPIAGYSAFGSYTGNGSTDGPFIYLGFRPRYVLLKRTDSTGNWGVWDTSRDPYNAVQYELVPNASDAETTAAGARLDILSNGFKLRNTGVAYNASSGTYIYACFAENPFKYSNAR